MSMAFLAVPQNCQREKQSQHETAKELLERLGRKRFPVTREE